MPFLLWILVMADLLLVMFGGALGSLARYGVGLGAAQLFGSTFPLGTMLINIIGSFLRLPTLLSMTTGFTTATR